MAAAPQNVRSSASDTIPFLMAFAAGVAAILIFSAGGAHQFLAELLLVVIMLAYGAWHVVRGDYTGRGDKLGDHLYYLGFLLTLTGLLIALIFFNLSDNLTSNLVRTFGIALVTTLIGMLLRTIAYQIHGEHDVSPEAAMVQLGDQIRTIGMQLHSASQFLTGAMAQTQQVFNETLDRLKTLLGQSEAALAAIVKQMNDLGGRLAAVEIPKDLLAQKLTPLTRSLNNNAARIDQATALMAGGIDKLNNTLISLEANSAGLNATMLKLLSVHDELDPLLELVRRICAEVDKLANQLSRSSDSITGAAAISAETLQRVADQSAQDAEMVARNRQSLDGELARIRTIAGETAAAFGPLAARIREREETETKLSTTYRAELERELAQIRDLHDELQTNAVSLIKFISDKLGNGRPVA